MYKSNKQIFKQNTTRRCCDVVCLIGKSEHLFSNVPAFIRGKSTGIWDGCNLPAESHNSNVPRSLVEGHGCYNMVLLAYKSYKYQEVVADMMVLYHVICIMCHV